MSVADGSTEIAIYDGKIHEMVNTPIGGLDVLNRFSDLTADIATTSLEDVKVYIKERLNVPKEKADVLILAGGAHKVFALKSGLKHETNTLYENKLQPIMMSLKDRIEATEKYFLKTSLDEKRSEDRNPNWWDGTRAISTFVIVIAESIGAKYIIPTDISMVYGIIDEMEKTNG